jgi:hypothetical protein
VDTFGWALRAIGSSEDRAVPEELRPVLMSMRERVEQREAKFAGDMLTLVRLLDPEAHPGHPNDGDSAVGPDMADEMERAGDSRVDRSRALVPCIRG